MYVRNFSGKVVCPVDFSILPVCLTRLITTRGNESWVKCLLCPVYGFAMMSQLWQNFSELPFCCASMLILDTMFAVHEVSVKFKCLHYHLMLKNFLWISEQMYMNKIQLISGVYLLQVTAPCIWLPVTLCLTLCYKPVTSLQSSSWHTKLVHEWLDQGHTYVLYLDQCV